MGLWMWGRGLEWDGDGGGKGGGKRICGFLGEGKEGRWGGKCGIPGDCFSF